MPESDNRSAAERLAEQVSRARRRAEQARRNAQAAQRSAADSLDRSAESQDRTARMYEEAAQHSVRHGDEYRANAAQRRKFAREDHAMAEQLREMADIDFLSRPFARPSSG